MEVFKIKVDVNINYIDSENLKSNSQLKGSDAILISGDLDIEELME